MRQWVSYRRRRSLMYIRLGVAYKSRKIVLIIGIILAAYYVFNIIYAAMTTGFSAFSLVGLIWPLLYLWGWYLSE